MFLWFCGLLALFNTTMHSMFIHDERESKGDGQNFPERKFDTAAIVNCPFLSRHRQPRRAIWKSIGRVPAASLGVGIFITSLACWIASSTLRSSKVTKTCYLRKEPSFYLRRQVCSIFVGVTKSPKWKKFIFFHPSLAAHSKVGRLKLTGW